MIGLIERRLIERIRRRSEFDGVKKSTIDNRWYGELFVDALEQRRDEAEKDFQKRWAEFLDGKPGSVVRLSADDITRIISQGDNADFIELMATAPYSDQVLPPSWFGKKHANEVRKHRILAGAAGIVLGLCGYATGAAETARRIIFP